MEFDQKQEISIKNSLRRWAQMVWDKNEIVKFKMEDLEKTCGSAGWYEPDEIASSIYSYILNEDLKYKKDDLSK